MGSVQSAAWYDDAYRADANLTADPRASTFGPLWLEMARRVPEGAIVREVGCGAGQLSALLAPKVARYLGFDFSRVAVEAASARVNGHARGSWHGHVVASVAEMLEDVRYHSPIEWNHTTLVACEVLEHLDADEDLAILAAHAGAHVIASLPTRDSAGHVRFFPSEAEVRQRYSPRIGGMSVARFDQWWIVEGRAR